MQVFYCIIAGIGISLSGSLPFGNLNVMAMNIAAKETVKKALWFAVGAAVVEMTYLRFTLSTISWVLAHKRLFLVCQWATVVLLLSLAIGSLMAIMKKEGKGKNVLIENNMNRFLLGVSISAVNPMQLPFWAGWATYLFTQNLLANSATFYNIFTLSAGTGTILALGIFIIAGRKFSDWMNKNNRTVQVVMFILFLLMAVFQVIRLV